MKTYNRDNLPPHKLKHSPTGMSWGYGGSCPSDLARSILWDVVGEEMAERFCQDFKKEFVEPWDADWSITSDDVIAWVTRKEEAHQAYLKRGKCVTCQCKLNEDNECPNKCPEITHLLADGIEVYGEEGIPRSNGGSIVLRGKIPSDCDLIVVCGNKGGGYVPFRCLLPHQLYRLDIQNEINENHWDAIYVLPVKADHSVLVALKNEYSKQRWDK